MPIVIPLRGATSPTLNVYFGTNQIANGGGLNFGQVLAGTTIPFTLTFSNAGPTTFTNPYVSLYSYVWDGGNFSFSPDAPQSGFNLVPGATTNFTMLLQPAASGSISNTLTILGNDDALLATAGQFTIGLSAMATNSLFTASLVSPVANATYIFPNPVPLNTLVVPSVNTYVQNVNYYLVSGTKLAFLGNSTDNTYNWSFGLDQCRRGELYPPGGGP